MIKILYVDDEANLLILGKQFLERSQDIIVDTAISASAANDMLIITQYDAIIADYQMPEMNGIEFLKSLRSAGNEIPVILFTGRGREEVVIEALNSGANFYVQKGGDILSQFADLEHKVRLAVRQNRTERALDQRNEILLEREKLFTKVLEHSGFGMSYWTPEGRLILINSMAAKFLRGTPETLVGRNGSELLDLETFNFYMERIKMALASPTPLEFEGWVTLPGRRAWMISVYTRVLDNSGIAHGVEVFAHDITERKITEMENQITIELFQIANKKHSLKELIPAVASFFEKHSNCEAVGIRLREEGDYPYIEVRGFPAHFIHTENSLCTRDENGAPLYDPVGNPALECMCGNVIQGRFDPSKPFFTKGGSFWTNSTTDLLASSSDEDRRARTRNRCNGEGYESVALIPLAVGDVRLGLIQLNDRRKGIFSLETINRWETMANYLAVIIAELRAKERLAASETRYRMLFNNSGDAVMLTRPDGSILSANPAACRMFEMTEEEIVLAGRDGILVNDENLTRALKVRAATGFVKTDLTFKKNDGTTFVGETSSTVFKGVDGTNMTSIMVRDTTERRLAEEALRLANNQLNLLNGVTRHDMLNQLSILSGYTTMMERFELGPKELEQVRKIQGSIQVLKSQLEFTRQYQEIGASPPIWQDLHHLISTAEQTLIKGDLSIEEAATNVSILADPMMERVVLNLIENVLRHSGGAKRLMIRSREEYGDLVLSFDDDGFGITADERKHLFERGYGKHTGFGLFMSREILKMTGLTIRERSEPGKGAHFEIVVPKNKFRPIKD